MTKPEVLVFTQSPSLWALREAHLLDYSEVSIYGSDSGHNADSGIENISIQTILSNKSNPGCYRSNKRHVHLIQGATMKARIVFGFIVMMFVLALPASAEGKGGLQKYFNDAATKVKATNDPSEKRAILNESFQTMARALNIVQNSPLISKNDRVSLERFRSALQEKQDELAGNNGYVRVSDGQLSAFSDYVVQDMEQADQTITISVVTLLLIIILIVLIVR
jgi:hypothetical protein